MHYNQHTTLLCWSCGGTSMRHIVTFEHAACTTQVTYPTLQAAKNAPTGTMTLFQCQDCGCMQNATFDYARIDYENYSLSLVNSPAYHKHLKELLSILSEKYQVENAKLVEIGCSDAHLLYTIAKATHSKGFGYDPSFDRRKEKLLANQPHDFGDYVTIFSEYFDQSAIHTDTDVLLCRHVLEHIPEPLTMLRSIHSALGAGGGDPLVVFEVPCLQDSSLWDYSSCIVYEHCSHFSPQALVRLFERAGFEVLETFKCYEKGIYQLIFACLARSDSQIYPLEKPILVSNNHDIISNMQAIDLKISCFSSVGVWTGHNAWSFKSQYLKNNDKIHYCIDSNPVKNGQFMAVSGLPIVLPQVAAKQGIEAVIVGNVAYYDEIAKIVSEQGYPFALIV